MRNTREKYWEARRQLAVRLHHNLFAPALNGDIEMGEVHPTGTDVPVGVVGTGVTMATRMKAVAGVVCATVCFMSVGLASESAFIGGERDGYACFHFVIGLLFQVGFVACAVSLYREGGYAESRETGPLLSR